MIAQFDEVRPPPLTASDTIYALLKNMGNWDAAAITIAAPGRQPLTYGRLMRQIEITVAALSSLGLRRNDRVAAVLPNGPEMAVAFLGIASGATCAPLNPAYREEEFDFYLSDLKARALIVPADMESPARRVA